MKDFAARSIGILQEAMRWAPSTTRSHLMQYLLQMDHSSRGLYQHSGLALITESVLRHAGYNRSAAALGVSTPHCCLWKCVGSAAACLRTPCDSLVSPYKRSPSKRHIGQCAFTFFELYLVSQRLGEYFLSWGFERMKMCLCCKHLHNAYCFYRLNC